jgi:hypothetical protein
LALSVPIMAASLALATGCGAPATRAPSERVAATVMVAQETVREAPAATEAPAAEAPLEVEAAPTPPAQDAAPVPVAYRANRMLIRNGELSLLVSDVDRAVDRVTQAATDSFGYILTSRTWYEGEFKHATITIGVPSEEFENTLRRLRGLALKVLDENTSGTDVTDEYVDLESRLRNLEATEARIREFLEKARTVKEALEVNAQLSQITGEIEQVKGRMNYLRDRAAYSTITVQLLPDVPPVTPTPTATITPVPTPTPTPTPVIWRPNETFQSAKRVLGSGLRALGDALIWIVVVAGPFALLAALVLWLSRRLWQGWRRLGKDK